MKQTIALNTPIAFDLWRSLVSIKTVRSYFLQRTVLERAVEETAMAINELDLLRGHL